jgi:hypothetical protein
MAVDLHIGAIETTLSATDPAALRTPEFLAAVVAAVREQLERDGEIAARRESDQAPRIKRRL